MVILEQFYMHRKQKVGNIIHRNFVQIWDFLSSLCFVLHRASDEATYHF